MFRINKDIGAKKVATGTAGPDGTTIFHVDPAATGSHVEPTSTGSHVDHFATGSHVNSNATGSSVTSRRQRHDAEMPFTPNKWSSMVAINGVPTS
jgi:hypothetical protein